MIEIATVKEELLNLKQKLSEAEVFEVTRKIPFRKLMKIEEEVKTMPALVGKLAGRQLNLDFLPESENLYIKVMDLSLTNGFEMFIEKKDCHPSLKLFKSRIPFAEINRELPPLGEKYLVQAIFLEAVENFLQDPYVGSLIQQLGNFERLTIDLRFIRLYRIFKSQEEIKAEKILADLEILKELAEKIEALN